MQTISFKTKFLDQFLGKSAFKVVPSIKTQPQWIIGSDSVAKLLKLEGNLKNSLEAGLKEDEAFLFMLGGHESILAPSSYATRYGGHQFGHWAGQLGDGRAIYLGEVENSDLKKSFEVQLKGAGETPFSRRGDGRAVFRSSIREFLCSEAMFYLGVPTTRALSCVLTGENVVRDLFYDGNPEEEPGAITTRVAESFLRFGHFEMLASEGDQESLRAFILFTIKHYFKEEIELQKSVEIFERDSTDVHWMDCVAYWFKIVSQRTAELMVHWSRVGFVHGVMNTDNLSIIGLTIDYGPYGFLDPYDPDFTPNTTDFANRRYRFSAQPPIALWNLEKLAQSIVQTADNQKGFASELIKGLNHYTETFQTQYKLMMLKKCGLNASVLKSDPDFIKQCESFLKECEIDYRMFFRRLSKSILMLDKIEWSLETQRIEIKKCLVESFYQPSRIEDEKFNHWLDRYFQLMRESGDPLAEVAKKMDEVNPFFILKNSITQSLIEDIQLRKDDSLLKRVYKALQTPYEENEWTLPFDQKRPEWAKDKPGCSALSCSS